MTQLLDQATIRLIKTNKSARLQLVQKSHKAFFATYFSHYIRYPSAPVHDEMFELSQDLGCNFGLALTFRGSGKSTILSMSYPIWSILGSQERHLVVLVSKTQEQARKLLDAIKREFETNTMLQRDFGRVFEESTPWNATALTFEARDAQILAISIDQSIRGVRFKSYRPDVFILDDIEDVASVRTKESRDKLEEWFEKDLIPAGDIGTRVILVGNNLHRDSLPNRVIQKVEKGDFLARVIFAPLIDGNGDCVWKGKFPTQKALDDYKATFPSLHTWLQEMLLQHSAQDVIVQHADIQRYETLPELKTLSRYYMAIGIDLACSLSDTADKTAMVPALVTNMDGAIKIYILPGTINKRLKIHESLDTCESIMKRIAQDGTDGKGRVRVFVESVAFQKTYVQQLQHRGLRKVEEYRPGAVNKTERLEIAGDLIIRGDVLFPQSGAEELIQQITGFGSERYDDLVDAFTTLVAKVIEHHPELRGRGFGAGNFEKLQLAEDIFQEMDEIEANIKGAEYFMWLDEQHRKGEVPKLF